MSPSRRAAGLHGGRYRILEQLGKGGMGAVYLAEDTRLPGRRVAVKENLTRDRESQEQFQREAVILARLRHPNLPPVTDYFVEPSGQQYLVMDYVPGDNLKQRVRRDGPLSENDLLACLRDILAALHYLHTWQDPESGRLLPVIHRDVKPANIKQMPDGRYVLVDFGIAKLDAGSATAVSARAFTPGFAPIEQYHGGTDARSDVYAVGATMYALLTGHVPPTSTSMATGTPLPPLRSFRRHIPGRYESVVQKALAIRPEDRYQSVAEMYQALFNEKLATSSTVEGHRQGGSGKPTTRRSTGRPRTIVKTIRRPPVAIALLSVGWLLAAVVWLILSGRGMSADRVAEQFTPAALTTVAQVSPASVTDDPVLTLTPTVEPTVVEPPSDANNTFALDAGMTPAATAVMVSTAIATIMATATSRSIAGTVTTETATKPAPTATQSSATRRPTSTPLATDTPRPLPTATATRPQPTAGPTVATPSGASVANPELVGTVALLSPVAGTTLNGGPRVPFEWTALAGGLPSNTLYELVFWPPGQDGLVAGLSPVGASEVTRVLVDLEVADRVLGDVVDARTNICWGVRLWDTAANRPVTMLTEGCRRFVYAGSPGGGASAVNTPWSGKN